MSLGLSIIAYDVIFNRLTTENGCLYFSNEGELNNLIKNINSFLIRKIDNKMKEIVKKKYRWNIIGNKYLNLFKEVIR